jgi:hypothetical protein
MQDRYVGDVGDFAKYGLLRRLSGRPGEREIRLGVVWCLYTNETHNDDGRHVSYLRKPEFEALDDLLLSALRKIVALDNRCISAVSGGGLLPDGTAFYDAPAAATAPPPRLSRNDRMLHRAEWLDHCLSITDKCDLVFFDPDNGVEVSSVRKHHRKAGKYIYWDELMPFWRRGQALLVYHHLNRTKPAARQVRELKDRFQTELDRSLVVPLVFRRGSCRVFWLIYRSCAIGTELERRALDFLGSGWSKHFWPSDWPDDEVIMLSPV